MHVRWITIWLTLGLLCPFLLQAQSWEFGGLIGQSTEKSAEVVPQTESNAGVFATLKSQKFRMGVRVEMNYQRNSEVLQVPIQATIPLDRQRLVELHAGPYLSTQQAPAPNQSRFRYGFATGLQVNLPLSRNWALVSRSQVQAPLTAETPAPSAEIQPMLAPSRQLSFSISFGLAYRLQEWKKKRAAEKARKRRVETRY